MIFSFFQNLGQKNSAIQNLTQSLVVGYQDSKGAEHLFQIFESDPYHQKVGFSETDKKKIFLSVLEEVVKSAVSVDLEDVNQRIDVVSRDLAHRLGIVENDDVQRFLHSMTLQIDTQLLEKNLAELPVVEASVVPKDGEKMHTANEVVFYEERRKRQYSSGHRGASVRVAKGATMHLGGSSGTSYSEDYLERLDVGQFFVSNQRVMFVGDTKTWNIPYKKMVHFEKDVIGSTPGIDFSSETSQKKKLVAFGSGVERDFVYAVLMRAVHTKSE